jgi:exodeoxyribonuclease VII large subunit
MLSARVKYKGFMDQISLGFERRQFSVSELTYAIADTMQSAFSGIWVSGEVSGLKMAASGHCYFTLKDDEAQIRCAVWKTAYRLLRAKPQDGMLVLARGRVEVYPPRGEYQLIVEAVEPLGLGALQYAFDQLRKKLTAEGLFDPATKRPLPALPQRIGIVTSPTGSVIRDILHVLARRFPGLHVRIYPALVQGQGSIEQVIEGIEYFSMTTWADLVIVARGGGSLEDLWTFNEEAVARAIANCSVPVISAIGHETDFTIADFVADLRAPTPSAAAEMAVPTKDGLTQQLQAMTRRAEQAIQFRVSQSARRLEVQGVERSRMLLERRIYRYAQRVDELDATATRRLESHLGTSHRHWLALDTKLRKLDLRLKIAQAKQRLETLAARKNAAVKRIEGSGRSRLIPLTASLNQLSPLKILDRGYSIVETTQGHVVSDPSTVIAGEKLNVRLAKGRLPVKVL